MITYKECNKDEYLDLIKSMNLHWIPFDYDDVYKIFIDNVYSALIQYQINTDDIDIFNFEVIVERSHGIGKLIIEDFINKYPNYKISLNANDERSEKFWNKCGFRILYKSEEEIRMIFWSK